MPQAHQSSCSMRPALLKTLYLQVILSPFDSFPHALCSHDGIPHAFVNLIRDRKRRLYGRGFDRMLVRFGKSKFDLHSRPNQ
jgi:hypothetical protein